MTYQEKFGTGKAVTTFAWTWNNGFFETQYKMTQLRHQTGAARRPDEEGLADGHGRARRRLLRHDPGDRSPTVDATWKLWRYLVGPDYLKRYCTLRGVQPSLKSMWTATEFSEDKGGSKWGALATKMKPGNNLDFGFNSIELGHDPGPAVGADPRRESGPEAMLAEVEKAANDYLKTNPQWSILSAADYKAHPEWMKPEG